MTYSAATPKKVNSSENAEWIRLREKTTTAADSTVRAAKKYQIACCTKLASMAAQTFWCSFAGLA